MAEYITRDGKVYKVLAAKTDKNVVTYELGEMVCSETICIHQDDAKDFKLMDLDNLTAHYTIDQATFLLKQRFGEAPVIEERPNTLTKEYVSVSLKGVIIGVGTTKQIALNRSMAICGIEYDRELAISVQKVLDF